MTRANLQRRYPLAPLMSACGVDDQSVLAERVGRSVRTIVRWNAQGLTDVAADSAACSVGFLPYEVWPDWELST